MRRTAIHPWEHLAEQLHVLGISASALGRQLTSGQAVDLRLGIVQRQKPMRV
jgi:hypothetical protein